MLVALCWFLPCSPDQADYAGRVLDALFHADDDLAIVPDLWHTEIAHVLLRAYRSRELKASSLDQATKVLVELSDKRLITTHSKLGAAQLLALSREYHLQVYDAVYFHIAKQRSLPLATVDNGLKTAAHRYAVAIF